ncbi:MAG: phosphonate C-P lyase system protein PhnH [Coriobacteriales bacterium]|jgi:alpha-D-ribose 1-methylphosphonate 5-triphosphate synthase subunit PhnH
MMDELDVEFPRRAEADAVSFRLQSGFRAILDAMARPGEVVDFGPLAPDSVQEGKRAGLFATTMSLADVLLDGETSVFIAGPAGAESARTLSQRTHAHVRGAEACMFCLIPHDVRGDEANQALSALSPGTLVSPHLGATAIVECSTLLGHDRYGRKAGSSSGTSRAHGWVLSGPGIVESAKILCDRSDILATRNGRGDEFPCGIDLMLVDGAGHVVCVPRSRERQNLV